MLVRVSSIGTGYIVRHTYSSRRLQRRVLHVKERMHGTKYRHGQSIVFHVRTTCAYRHIFPVLPRVCVKSPRRGSSSAVPVARDSATLTPNQCTYQLWRGPALGPGSGSSRGRWGCPLPARFSSVIPRASGYSREIPALMEWWIRGFR